MYSQYMDGNFSPIGSQSQQYTATPQHKPNSKKEPSQPSDLLGGLTGGISQLLSGIGKQFSVGQFDTGDILLVLIILFLFLEGDNLELVITLGLMLLLGFNED